MSTLTSNNPTLEKIQYFRQFKRNEITLDQLAEKVYEIDTPRPSKRLRRTLFLLSLVFAFFLPKKED